MNILINMQSFDDNAIYQELVTLSQKDCINKIYLSSSLMNDVPEDLIDKYSKLKKIIILKTNNLFSINNMSDSKFNMHEHFLQDESYLHTDLLSSYRWLPISKRKDNDFLSFSMVFYYDVYNYWNNFFNENLIDFVIQLNEEHSSLDSILVRVAKKYKISNIITSRPVGAFTANSEEYHAIYDNNSESYMAVSNHLKNSTPLDTNSDFTVFSKKYKSSSKNKFTTSYHKFKHLIFDHKISTSLKIKNLYNTLLNKTITYFLLFKQYYYVKNIKKHYFKLATKKANLNVNYIYYCIHFDPEAATLPKDNANANQLLNIRILASSLPDGWKLYVKEHPHQLNHKIYFGYLLNQLHAVDNFRSKNFYNYINNLENVELVGLNNNHQEVMKNAKFIASNTGTVFREASYLYKHCLTFSKNSFYEMLSNVHSVSDRLTCTNSILKYSNEEITNENVDKLFDGFSVTITDINNISSIMLKEIFNIHKGICND